MTVWEYLTLELGDAVLRTPALLNTAGEAGWELVTVLPSPHDPHLYRAIFKRPRTS